MIKAACRRDGKPLYIIGLSESNLARLEVGAPIAFSGRELQVAGVHVLIVYKPANARTLNVPKIYKAFGLARDTTLCALTLDRAAVDLLRASGCIVTDQSTGGLPGDVWLLYAPSEAELVAHFNDTIGTKLVQTPAPGERYELDPATGRMVRTIADA